MRIAPAMGLLSAVIAQGSAALAPSDLEMEWNCTTLETRRVYDADQREDPRVREITGLLDPVARPRDEQDRFLRVPAALPEDSLRFAIEAERKACREGSAVPVVAELALDAVRITACAPLPGPASGLVRHERHWRRDPESGWRLVKREERIDPGCAID